MIPERAPHHGAFSYPSELSLRRQPVFGLVMVHSPTDAQITIPLRSWRFLSCMRT